MKHGFSHSPQRQSVSLGVMDERTELLDRRSSQYLLKTVGRAFSAKR
jgi:hypothetical protein